MRAIPRMILKVRIDTTKADPYFVPSSSSFHRSRLLPEPLNSPNRKGSTTIVSN